MATNTPDPSAGRPPIVPPTPVAIHAPGGGDDQDPIVRSLLHLVEHMRRRDLEAQLDVSPSSRNILDAVAALKVAASEAGQPVTIAEIVEELERQRADLQDQIELERLVARPPKKGYDLIHDEDDRPTAIEKTLALNDLLLGTLKKFQVRSLRPEDGG